MDKTLCGRLFFTPSLLVKGVRFSKHKFNYGVFNWRYITPSSGLMWHPYYLSEIYIDNYLERLEIYSNDESTVSSILRNEKFKNGTRIHAFDQKFLDSLGNKLIITI